MVNKIKIMFGFITKKERNALIVQVFQLTLDKAKASIENSILKEKLNTLKFQVSKLKDYESKEFRKKELEQYFAEARLNGLIPREHFEVSWKEYQSLFQKESCVTKKDLQKDKNQQSLLNSVKEVLDWYNNKDLKFTPETQTEVKDMFLNLHISYNNVSNTEETTQTT